MNLILQIWGGSCYLLNKILFSLAQNREHEKARILKITGWIIYILGVPAWAVILFRKHDWIAGFLEVGGLPSMVFGLVSSINPHHRAGRYFDHFARIVTVLFILLGTGYSILDFGGLKSLSQGLEILTTIGFLAGSYYMARNHPVGWFFFMLMNAGMGALMLIQGHPLLALQQMISLLFVTAGCRKSLKSSMAEEQFI